MVLMFSLLPGADAMAAPANHLALETSPYLRQHAHNPVDWFPWGDEALGRAREENKPIFLSIGYAACHWCHVMERESFTDPGVAELLKKHFISIKVDREERPDLDAHFMEMAVSMTGHGGWPLNLFLTPSLLPLYVGTYFPPQSRYGLPSFAAVVEGVGEQWRARSAELSQKADELQSQLFSTANPWEGQGGDTPGQTLYQVAVDFWRGRFDARHGGFGGAPKFPQPALLSMLMRAAALHHQPSLTPMVEQTLDRMAVGGMRDQLGGAFHRYATDEGWHVPHFEIMLYDNALLARIYLEAYQRSGRSRYAGVVRQILDDVLQRLALPDGGFASSLDADSDGGEGLFYTWTGTEIDAVLGQARGRAFREAFFDPKGEKLDGREVLHFQGAPDQLMESLEAFATEREKLLIARQQRPAPSRDDKVLTSWNALLVSALAKAGAALKEPRYLEAARAAMTSLTTHARGEKGWIHSRLGASRGSVVFLEDYAFLTQALLDLYEAGLDTRHLMEARALGEEMLRRFQPGPGAPLQNLPVDQPTEIPPRVELEDQATPSAHGAALVALARLALASGDQTLEEAVMALRAALTPMLEKMAPAAGELLWAWDLDPASAREVVIAGPLDHPATRRLVELYQGRFLPHATLALVPPDWKPDGKLWPALAGRVMLNGEPTAYVCQQRVCLKPVHTPTDFLERLESP